MEAGAGTVLVTGAGGFIGSRLVKALKARNHKVRCLVRSRKPDVSEVEQVAGDLLQPLTLPPAFQGVDTAFYLVHSMAGGAIGFESRDRQAAENFAQVAEQEGVRRVIYLGGLGETGTKLSPHLSSRLEVAKVLSGGPYAATVLRAAIIIGAGGASFEMIRQLVNRLPIMVTPRWVSTRCQPISVTDVISYLLGCLEEEETAGQTYDIGGPDILTYREMMERFAKVASRPLIIVPTPFLTPHLSSYWVGFITSVNPSVSMPLIEGLRNEVVCRDNRIRSIISLPLQTYEEAVSQALAE